jgi:hypothetical protein
MWPKRLPTCFSMRIMLVSWHVPAETCCCPSPTTIFSSLSVVIDFKLQTWNTFLYRLIATRYEYGRSLSAPILILNVILLQTERFPVHRLMFPRSETPLTASLIYVCIYALFRPAPSSRNTVFIVPGQAMGSWGVWTSDSCFPHRDTSSSIERS